MGKVHGSLARAGKVEPQEKKKTPKGRAYKRVQYTRRFVNVTMTGGKRKVHTDPQPHNITTHKPEQNSIQPFA
ncbi:40S ribosomal protein S30 [Penicillium hispanicum]|uniref:40S ribosomal protein S30 n=1 Tax=Penicillium hispanicum TaxID=1080232 RepID=UPI002540BFEF|nr:40S ribosomal protein S30 [Penicillium hispanicum]KAJ5591542.1 40S ribosomal protein S30 [Penicillium hispanicum]